MPHEHEHVGPVNFDPEVIRKKRVGMIGDGQRFRVVFCEQGLACHLLEFTRRLLAGPAVTFRLLRANASARRNASSYLPAIAASRIGSRSRAILALASPLSAAFSYHSRALV